MIFNQTNWKELRDLFCDAVTKVFGDSMTFLDFLENGGYSAIKYDCYLDYNGENYIINRETGEYINWYKLDHIGRCINISTLSMDKSIPEWIEGFLVEFKESEDTKKCQFCGSMLYKLVTDNTFVYYCPKCTSAHGK